MATSGRNESRDHYFGLSSEENVSLEWDEIQKGVDEAIFELPEKYRDAVVEHFLKCQTHDRVAKNLGVSRQTITYRVDKGIDQIRAILRRNGYTVGAVALASMLQSITVEAVPLALSTSLSKRALSGIGAGGFSLSSWLVSMFGGYSIWTKMMFGATALMALLASLGWGLGMYDPVRLNEGVASAPIQQIDGIEDSEFQFDDEASTAITDASELDDTGNDLNPTFALADEGVNDEEDEEEE